MAEAVALAGLGWVASPVVKDLVAKSIFYLGNDIAKDLEDLETTVLPQIGLTIKAAQHSHPEQKAELAKWLARLKNAYYDAEGILHELDERLKRKVKGEDKLLVRLSSKLIVKPLAKVIGPVVKKASLLSPRKRELLQRLNKLKEVAAEAKDFRDLLKDHKQIAAEAKTESKDGIAGHSRSDTSSILTDKVFGKLVKVKNSYKLASAAPKPVSAKPAKPKAAKPSTKPKGKVAKSAKTASPAKAKAGAKTKSKPVANLKAKPSTDKTKKAAAKPASAPKPKAVAKAKKEAAPKAKEKASPAKSKVTTKTKVAPTKTKATAKPKGAGRPAKSAKTSAKDLPGKKASVAPVKKTPTKKTSAAKKATTKKATPSRKVLARKVKK